jgi:DNA repair exonuclease SbcCD ATPase subunit
MSPSQQKEEFNRIYDEITELRNYKSELATLTEFKTNSEEKIRELKGNIEKLFDKIEGGNGTAGLKEEITSAKHLVQQLEDNVNEIYDRLSKIESILEKTIREIYELTPIVKALMTIETERKEEKSSFRREFRMWVIGFIGTVLVTATVTWVNISNNKAPKQDEIKEIVSKSIQLNQINQEHIIDSLKLELAKKK